MLTAPTFGATRDIIYQLIALVQYTYLPLVNNNSFLFIAYMLLLQLPTSLFITYFCS